MGYAWWPAGWRWPGPVGLFITMQACSLFCLREDGGPGWHDLGVSPGPSGNMTAQQYDDAVCDTGMAGIEELLRSCDSLGCRFLVCEAGLQFWRMSERLRPDLPVERTGIASIVAESDTELLFI